MNKRQRVGMMVGMAAMLTCGLATQSSAQGSHAGHGTQPSSPVAKAPASASTQAYEAAAARMHSGMAIPYTGNSDVDFARGMIPHHRGAIDMARVQLQHGKDPAMRKLAQEVIDAQETEISFLQEWLRRHENRP